MLVRSDFRLSVSEDLDSALELCTGNGGDTCEWQVCCYCSNLLNTLKKLFGNLSGNTA